MSENKDLSTLFAECAIGGFVLHHLAGDYGPLFVVTRDELTRQFNNPEEVRAWLYRIEGRHMTAATAANLSIGTPLNAGAV